MDSFTTTDLTVIALSVIYISIGWRGGIFHALVGPAAFLISYVMGIIYLDVSGNLIMAVILTLISTLIIWAMIKGIYYIINKETDKNFKDFTFLGSRVIGAALSWGWRMALTGLVIIVFMVFPVENPALVDLKKDIQKSYALHLMDEYVLQKLPFVRGVGAVFATFQDQAKFRQLQDSYEFKRFFEDTRVQDLLYDEDFLKYLGEKNYYRALSDPRMIKIIRDDKLMEYVYKFSKNIYKKEMAGEWGETPAAPPPSE